MEAPKHVLAPLPCSRSNSDDWTGVLGWRKSPSQTSQSIVNHRYQLRHSCFLSIIKQH